MFGSQFTHGPQAYTLVDALGVPRGPNHAAAHRHEQLAWWVDRELSGFARCFNGRLDGMPVVVAILDGTISVVKATIDDDDPANDTIQRIDYGRVEGAVVTATRQPNHNSHDEYVTELVLEHPLVGRLEFDVLVGRSTRPADELRNTLAMLTGAPVTIESA